MIELTNREKALVVQTATIAGLIGIWVGIGLVPDAALSVPTEETPSGRIEPAYTAIPTYLPLFTVAVLAVGTYAAYGIVRQVSDNDDEAVEQDTNAMADGGSDE